MQWPTEVPLMTLPNAILFPDAMMPLYIFEPRYRKMLEDALETNRMFSVAMRKPSSKVEAPFRMAGLGLIRASVKARDGTSHVILQGLARVELGPAVKYKPYRVQRIQPVETRRTDTSQFALLTEQLLNLVARRLEQGAFMPETFMARLEKKLGQTAGLNLASVRQIVQHLVKLDDPDKLADMVSCTFLSRPMERQTILETTELEHRLMFLISFLDAEIKRSNQGAKNG